MVPEDFDLVLHYFAPFGQSNGSSEPSGQSGIPSQNCTSVIQTGMSSAVCLQGNVFSLHPEG